MNAVASIGTTRTGEDRLKTAVEQLVAVFKADFGRQWRDQFANDEDLRQWKRRAYARLRGVEGPAIVEGYERAVQERRPYMPNLVDLVESIRQVHGERQRASEQIARISPPQCDGLHGYVDTVLVPQAKSPVARECLSLMQEIRSRPTVPPEHAALRQAKALAVHQELLAKAPPIRHRGEVQTCAVAGCGQRGSHTHAVNGQNPVWLCVKHWREG